MPLSAIELAERLWDGSSEVDHRHTLGVVPLVDVDQLRTKHTASLDLRLGRWFRTMRQTKVTSLKAGDDRKEDSISREHYVRFNDHFVLHPGQFVLGITLEWLNLPIDLLWLCNGEIVLGPKRSHHRNRHWNPSRIYRVSDIGICKRRFYAY